jgi:hypothetical protein
LGGATFPDRVIDHVNGLLEKNPSLPIEQFQTNWNSPNFDNPSTPAGNPGRFPGTNELLAIAVAPAVTPFVIASMGAIPFTDESFVDALSTKLQNEYEDDDTIILIGHSFGGDSLLKVANRLEGIRQIDVLATLDPVGFSGFRGNLPNPGSNVKYFFNRWQEILPFPIDFSTSGRLDAGSDLVNRDFQIPGQDDQSTRRLADGGSDWHGPTALELSLIVGSPQYFKTTFYDPITDFDEFSKYPLGKTEAKSLTHQYLPLDEYISKQLIRVLDGVIPQPPIIEATVTPAGVFDEGMTLRIDASASYDPNVGQSIHGFEWSSSDPRIVLPQGSLDLSVAIGDDFDPPANPLVITLKAWDGPRYASGTKESSRQFTIISRNVDPRNVVIQGPGQYVRGFEVPLTATFEDPGFLDEHTGDWSVSGSTVPGGVFRDFPTKPSRVTTASPLYQAEGTYSVRVTVEDGDGGSAQSAIAPLQIVPVGLVPNPSDPSLRDLLVGGSTQTDSILVTHGPTPDSYVVTMNGTTYGPYEVTGDIRIAGQAGNDRIEIGSGDLSRLRRPIFVESGSGMGTIVLNDAGRVTATDYLVTPTSVTVTDRVSASRFAVASAAGFGGLTYTGSTHFLEVLGTDGVNTFDVQPSHNTRYLIDGNLPAAGSVIAAEGDFLKLDTKTTFPADPDGLDTSGRRLSMTARGEGTWEFSITHQAVDFLDIERFNHVDRVAVAADAGATSKPVVRVYDAETKAFLFEIPAASTYGDRYRDGVRVATGDLDNDGIPDVVTAPGRMAAPVIKVFNGAPIPGTEGKEIVGLRLNAAATYGAKYAGGVQVAVGDVVGDALNDIVVAPSRGKAVVKVFKSTLTAGAADVTNKKVAARSFDAFADFPKFIGGATVATAKFDDSGKHRVVVGSASGMPAVVRVFNVRANAARYIAEHSLVGVFPKSSGGVQVAAGDIDGDGFDDLVMGAGAAGGTWLRVRQGRDLKTELLSFQFAAGRDSTVPTRFAVRDITGDGRAEIFAAFGNDARTGYRILRQRNRSASTLDEMVISSPAFSGGGLNLG